MFFTRQKGEQDLGAGASVERKALADLGGEADGVVAFDAIDAYGFEAVEDRQVDRLARLRMERLHHRPGDAHDVELLDCELADFKGADADAVALRYFSDESVRFEGFEHAEGVVLGHAQVARELAWPELMRWLFEGAQYVQGAGDRRHGVRVRACRGMHHRTALG